MRHIVIKTKWASLCKAGNATAYVCVMSIAVCFSNYFVNKQNVRSFSNIFNMNLLKTNSKEIKKHIFEEECLVSVLSLELLDILNHLITNIKTNCSQDFKNFFSEHNSTKDRKLVEVNKNDVFQGCEKGLNKIIPKTLFGCNHNYKIFRKCIKIIIFTMRKQCYIFENLLQSWDYSVEPWNKHELKNSQLFLKCILLWLFKYILSAIICLNFYVTTRKDLDENKLYYFWKSNWHHCFDKEIHLMMLRGTIVKAAHSLGKLARRKYSMQERLKIKQMNQEIPRLHLVLKSNNDFRPIVRYKNNMINSSEKYKVKERLILLRKLNGKENPRVETQFQSLYSKWSVQGKPTLYFVKTDLSNAFGCINRSKLFKVIAEKHFNYKKTEYSQHLNKKIATHLKELVSELHSPLLVRIGSSVYEWKTGLVQGYQYSPALAELYYSYMDDLYFKQHIEHNEIGLKLFARVVDDYLYITDSVEDAITFLDKLSNYPNVNKQKTVINFQHKDFKHSKNITFVGYNYDTEKLIVSRANKIFTGQMCFKITFSPAIVNLVKFLENRVGQSAIPINRHIFNLYHKDEEIIWRHIFITFCISANKFCSILSVICPESEMFKYIPLYKRVTLKLCNSIINVLLQNTPEDYSLVFCINHICYVSFKALQLCAKRTSKCSVILPYINTELAKTNCLFGKWREHASRLGETKIEANRIICRRTDLRKIMKEFEELPAGFLCYNNIY
ncbi:uncharacterized protein LOC126978615 isoform X2 [Leptidea sinapis]|uniref:uncharacterized protein LOC126978615 isoform X2 n=1 Tax=Leptidea sinapis TaxID=189913 RepID=UPI0021C28566|nr:uncharacterized protein LOC126978615 isoform X2 [Leptidea sinapis]